MCLPENREPIYDPINFPPTPLIAKKRTCPESSFALIEIGAKLADRKISPVTKFCTHAIPDPDSIRTFDPRDSYLDYKTDCLRVWATLFLELDAISTPKKQETNDYYSQLSKAYKIIETKSSIVLPEKTKYNRPEILKRWRRVIWETCCNSRGENPHFRTIDSPSNLSNEEAIRRVRSFTEALGKTFDNCPRRV